jgi:O-antigen/teichoic acid export membrane protein
MTRLQQVRSLAYYFVIPAISIVTPLIVFPALTLRFGAAGLAAVGVAQSLGSAGAVIAELGWGVVGPQRVARADHAGRRALYESALASKLIATSILAPLVAMIAFVVVQNYRCSSAVMAFAFCLSALSPSWFLIGCNRPLVILFIEAIPRLIFSVGSALAILAGGLLELYGSGMILASIVTLLLTARVTRQHVIPPKSAFIGAPRVMRVQLPVTTGRIISVVYTFLSITIASIANPSSTALFTAVERLMRMALSVLGGVPSRLQSWVGVRSGAERIRRSRSSLALNTLLGLVSAIAFAALAPLVAPFVFSDTVDLGFSTSALSATVLFVICVSRGFGLSLVAEGRPNWITIANLGAAVVGGSMIFVLARSWGAHGAILGELAAELVGVGVQAVVLVGASRWTTRPPTGMRLDDQTQVRSDLSE